ncbi:ABC transporter permease [Enterococcus raffinosus]|uniref:ABC transporter permease subunit n=1 Tax=Enterococcus raffinosus TaxID=71452 RepID=UPI001C0FCA44|nr:ABC transporter permease subunit [Enterococcus raffinosus]MBU5363003.1 ABC transporter permease [Enterococcus raffinosus]
MNLFLREMKRNLLSTVIWLTILIIVNGMMLASFESVAEMAKNTEAMLAQYPKEFVQALSLDQLKMTDILHFYASRSFLLVSIFGSVYAILLTSSMLSKEESEKTIEFLLSKPINRTSLLTSKLLCSFTLVTLFNLSFSVSNWLLLTHFKTQDFDPVAFLFISFGAWGIHLIFLFIGFTLSAYITKNRRNTAIALGCVFLGYFLSIAASLKETLSILKYASPFSYFNTEDLVIAKTIQPTYLFITLFMILFCIGLTYYHYGKKDIAV